MEYDLIADLPLVIEETAFERHRQDTVSGFTRVTTELSLTGPAETGEIVTGRGEDVIYDEVEHERLADHGLPPVTGSFTIEEFSAHLDTVDLFPAGAPDRPVYEHYRRWAFESAALDLALRQAATNLASVLGRSYDPVRFVASPGLGDPPSIDRLDALAARVPDVAVKLDPTTDWSEHLIDAVAATDRVRILDLKGQYQGTTVETPGDPALYGRLIETFPNAVLEDPDLAADIDQCFEPPAVRERVSWDAPIHRLEDLDACPWPPSWLNVKPSRFGTLRSLFETIGAATERDISCYGGGQFELGVGRAQIQELASLAYPDGPNDVAPRVYNWPDLPATLPASPLQVDASVVGFGEAVSP